MLDAAVAHRLKLVGFDVDGVLTDNGIYVGMVGDDLADLPLLTRVGLPIAVANGVTEVKAAARVVTTVPGGHGAVREVAELILKARGEWQGLLTKYFLERGDVPHGAQRTR